MREIKFRQPEYLANKFHRWHYWGFNIDGEGGFVGPIMLSPSQQYTGLKDKNGKKIYHRDIVKWTHQTDADKHFTKVVEWSNERAGWILSGHPMNRIDLFSPETNLEIIGDIHTTPKLMEAKDA